MLRHEHLVSLAEQVSRTQLTGWIRTAIQACRCQMLAGAQFCADSAVRFVVEHTKTQHRAEEGRRQQPVINATGILLHTNLGRAPIAPDAAQRMLDSTGYTNVELNLQTGKRSGRGDRAVALLQQLSGAEDAVVVNNCAAATMLVLQTLAAGREVIVSRGQLVEIGGGYRLPEVFAAAGVILKEVGTTNRTYLHDYENAISDNTAALIRVHRSNFFQGGFVTEPDLAELVSLGRERRLAVIDDIGSGCMTDLSSYGLAEPTVTGSVAAGADLTLFSGDKLFGGPQAGIIVGRSSYLCAVRKSPMMRALRVDKVTLAGIEATAEIHLAGQATSRLPLLQMLATDGQLLRHRCLHICKQLTLPAGIQVDVTECVSEIGGGSVPGSKIPSFALRIGCANSDMLARRLRCGRVPVLARIHDNMVLLDLRTVAESQLPELTSTLQQAIDTVADGGADSTANGEV